MPHIGDSGAGDLAHPQSATELLHYRLASLESFCGTIVTRLCEGEFGITRREWRFIALLRTLGDMTPSVLASQARLTRGCTSKTLATLHDKGVVQKLAVGGDARSQRITLTATGHALHDEVFATLAAVNREILSAVPAAELERLSSLLHDMETQAQRGAQAMVSGAHADRRHGGSRKRWQARHPPQVGTPADESEE